MTKLIFTIINEQRLIKFRNIRQFPQIQLITLDFGIVFCFLKIFFNFLNKNLQGIYLQTDFTVVFICFLFQIWRKVPKCLHFLSV